MQRHMSSEAEKKHVAKAKQIVVATRTWSDAKLDRFRFPFPKGALKVTQLRPGHTYHAYNIDNINPENRFLTYYVGKKWNEHILRYGGSRGMIWPMYKYRGQWVCCSGANRVAFFGPCKSIAARKSTVGKKKSKRAAPKKSSVGKKSKARAGRRGPAQSALDFAIGTRRRGLDGEMWKIIRMHSASGKATKRWQRISKA